MMGDEDDFDENDMDMAAAMAGDPGANMGADDDDMDMDMAAAMAGDPGAAGSAGDSGGNGAGESSSGNTSGIPLELVSAVEKIGIDITAVLGTADMKVSNLLKIGRGAVIELDKKVGDTIELHVSGKPIARGEVVVVEDHLAVSITEVFKIGMFHET